MVHGNNFQGKKVSEDCLIRAMERKDFDEVLEMMRIFYDSPAVFHTSSDAVLIRDIEDCLSENPFVWGFVFEMAEGSELADTSAAAEKRAAAGKSAAEKRGLAGYAMIAPSYTTEYGGLCVWLEDLYLKPEYRGQHLTGEFFTYLEEQYPNAVRFKLEVEEENAHAIAVYKRNGYGISPYFEMTKEMIQD